jgi:hypothetical protein
MAIGKAGGYFADQDYFRALFVCAGDRPYFNNVSGMNDERFAVILPSLKRIHTVSLGLWTPEMTDQSIPLIAQLDSLEELHIDRTGITPAGVAGLRSLPKLRRIRAWEPDWTEQDLRAVEAQLPGVDVELVDNYMNRRFSPASNRAQDPARS